MAAYEPSSHPQPIEEARALHHLSGDTNWSYNPDTGLLWDVPNFVKTPPPQEAVDAIIEQNLTIKELTDNGYEEEVVNEVYAKIIKNEYKRRQAPIGIRVSNKAFGMGRRFPIVNQYREKNK